MSSVALLLVGEVERQVRLSVWMGMILGKGFAGPSGKRSKGGGKESERMRRWGNRNRLFGQLILAGTKRRGRRRPGVSRLRAS